MSTKVHLHIPTDKLVGRELSLGRGKVDDSFLCVVRL